MHSNIQKVISLSQYTNATEFNNVYPICLRSGGEILPKTQPEQPFPSHVQLPLSPQSIQPLPQIFPANALPANAIQSWNSADEAAKWPQQMPQFPMKPYQPYNQYGQSDAQQTQNQPFQWPIVPVQSNPVHLNPNTEEVLPDNTVSKDVAVADRKKDGRNTLHEDEKKVQVSTESSEFKYEDEDEQATTEPPKKKKKHRKVNKVDNKADNEEDTAKASDDNVDTTAQQMKLLHEKLQTEYIEHDGAAERPSGAVISLAMGTS